MPTTTEIKNLLDTQMAANDTTYADNVDRTQAKATLWKTIAEVLQPYTGSRVFVMPTAPLGTDDSADGYEVGDRWIDTVGQNTYTLVDATVGVAVWVQEDGGGGGGAPTNAQYITAASNGSLSAERVATDTGSVVWDFGTAGQAKATVPDATTSAKGIVELATNGETAAGVVVQGNDSRLTLTGLGGAPDSADYLVKTANGSLSAERVVTDTASVVWDWATSGQAKATVPDADASTKGLVKLAKHLGGSAALPEVVGLTETSGPTSLTIGSIADGKTLVRSGSSVVGGADWAPVYCFATSTATSSTTPGDVTGLSWTVISGATYLLEGWGKLQSSSTGVALRMGIQGTGGLTVSDSQSFNRYMNTATADQPGYANSLGTVSGQTAASNTVVPFDMWAYLVTTAGGTLTVQIATEIGGTTVTLQYGIFRLTRVQ